MNNSFCVGLKPDVAYIYVWLSMKEHIIYVGQTCSAHGVLGRARQHISGLGTLNSNLSKKGYVLEEIEDFFLFSFELPKDWRYTNSETTYRCAVEYLVQIKCRTILPDKVGRCFSIVSRVDYNQKCETIENREIARKIIDELLENINIIMNN